MQKKNHDLFFCFIPMFQNVTSSFVSLSNAHDENSFFDEFIELVVFITEFSLSIIIQKICAMHKNIKIRFNFLYKLTTYMHYTMIPFMTFFSNDDILLLEVKTLRQNENDTFIHHEATKVAKFEQNFD